MNNIASGIIIAFLILIVVIFSGWFHIWPIVEAVYANDWSIIWETQRKLILFIVGGIIFYISLFLEVKHGVKMII